MALFRPYQRPVDESPATGSSAAPLTAEDVVSTSRGAVPDPRSEQARQNSKKRPAKQSIAVEASLSTEPEETLVATAQPKPVGKQGPTPTRKQAEAERMERLHPTLSKKEQKQRNREASIKDRQRSQELYEAAPERVLLRNYVDARWTFSEFVWPILLILMAMAMIGIRFPQVLPISTVLAWITMLGMVIDVWICWRGFKRELFRRYPRAKKGGLLGYLMSRMMTPRRWRQPGPAIPREPFFGRKRGTVVADEANTD